jgi:hypothetical protein
VTDEKIESLPFLEQILQPHLAPPAPIVTGTVPEAETQFTSLIPPPPPPPEKPSAPAPPPPITKAETILVPG